MSTPDYRTLPEIEQPPHDERSYREQRQQDRVKWLLHSSVGSVLEVGCADGHIVGQVGRPACCGVDFDQVRVREAKRKHPQVSFYVLDARFGLPFQDASYDTVMCPEVLEHMEFDDTRYVLRESLRVAASQVLITVPYAEGNFHRGDVYNPSHRWVPDRTTMGQLLGSLRRHEHMEGGFLHVAIHKEEEWQKYP